ncbi:hypothetical protein CRUP_020639 [Coryphaenoides rupestris]|nr:hypothetical protein CRUP_020639 [Coryphaenoides rupestris]
MSAVDSKSGLKVYAADSSSRSRRSRNSVHRGGVGGVYSKRLNSKRVKQEEEPGSSAAGGRAIEAETREPCLSVGEHCYTGRSPVCSVVNLPGGVRSTEGGGRGGGEEGGPTSHHQAPSCSQCSGGNGGKSVPHNCGCSTSGTPAAPSSSSSPSSGSSSSSESVRRSSDEKTNEATIGTRKRKRKKKRERVQTAGARGVGAGPVVAAGAGPAAVHRRRRRRLCLERPRRGQMKSVKTTSEPADATAGGEGKDRRRKSKQGKKLDTSTELKREPTVEAPFKLVCSSVDELRNLISKTEDQLDALQSTKKRSGRWYLKKEAVKDLHITLIRLLNELLPWEPKLLKAFQRNRYKRPPPPTHPPTHQPINPRTAGFCGALWGDFASMSLEQERTHSR